MIEQLLKPYLNFDEVQSKPLDNYSKSIISTYTTYHEFLLKILWFEIVSIFLYYLKSRNELHLA